MVDVLLNVLSIRVWLTELPVVNQSSWFLVQTQLHTVGKNVLTTHLNRGAITMVVPLVLEAETINTEEDNYFKSITRLISERC